MHNVAQQSRRAIDVIDDDIYPSFIKQIPEGGTPGRSQDRQAAAGRGRNWLETLAVQVPEKQRPLAIGHAPVVLVHSGVNVPVGGEDVLPAIVIEIQKS